MEILNRDVLDIIKYKFGEEYDETETKIYLFKLYNELVKIFDGNDDEYDDEDEFYKKPHPMKDGMVTKINDDDFPEDVIPFVVVRDKNLFLDYSCPCCNSKSKMAITKFDRSQYKEYVCPSCNENILMKLMFEPEIRIYTEHKGGN